MTHTKYELARIIGCRALQITMGAPFLIKIDNLELKEMDYDPIAIAKKEYEKGVIPISIRRILSKKNG